MLKAGYDPLSLVITASCKTLDIPVFELQHGHIYYGPPGYTLPASLIEKSYPDYLIVENQVYQDTTVKSGWPTQKILLGYTKKSMITDTELTDSEEDFKQNFSFYGRDNVLVINQHSIASIVADFLKSADSADHLQFLVKMHPKHRDEQLKHFEDFENVENITIVPEGISLEKCLSWCTKAVGVYSTGLIEASKAALDVYIIDVPGFALMDDLCESGVFRKISDCAHFDESLEGKQLMQDASTSAVEAVYAILDH